MKKNISMFTRLTLIALIYEHWLKDVLVQKCKREPHYVGLIELCDEILLKEVE